MVILGGCVFLMSEVHPVQSANSPHHFIVSISKRIARNSDRGPGESLRLGRCGRAGENRKCSGVEGLRKNLKSFPRQVWGRTQLRVMRRVLSQDSSAVTSSCSCRRRCGGCQGGGQKGGGCRCSLLSAHRGSSQLRKWTTPVSCGRAFPRSIGPP